MMAFSQWLGLGGLLVVAGWFAWLRRKTPQRSARVQVVEAHRLGRHGLYLVRVDSHTVLLGTGPDGITHLRDVPPTVPEALTNAPTDALADAPFVAPDSPVGAHVATAPSPHSNGASRRGHA